MASSFNQIRVWAEQKNITVPSLFFMHYKEVGITDEEALILLHVIAYQHEGVEFPTPAMVEARTSFNQNTISMHYQTLMQKGLLQLTQNMDENGILFEKFSFYPLWERILLKLEQRALQAQKVEVAEKATQLDDRAIFSLLEQELGRLLSPIEIETVSMWIDHDHHSPEIIKEAIKEAVLANKTSLRYIDRILFEWKKKQIKTVEQVHQHTEQFRAHTVASTPRANQQKAATNTNDERPKSTFYNWLDERE